MKQIKYVTVVPNIFYISFSFSNDYLKILTRIRKEQNSYNLTSPIIPFYIIMFFYIF